MVDTKSLELEANIKQWLNWDKNETTRQEIISLDNDKNFEKLNDLLMKRLSFGTAGLRGVMQAGYNGMNDLVIIQTTQGLASYLIQVCPDIKQKGIVLGYDARYNSQRFAQLSAVAFLNKGIPVHLFSKIVPTPFVPYALLQLGCCAGVMVTASHNPKKDNGYKVYWTNGAQIISPHDVGIQTGIKQNLEPWENAWDTTICQNQDLCKDPLPDILTSYMAKLSNLPLDKSLNANTKLKFTYTSIHGVGYSYIKEALKAFSLPPCIPVKEQVEPDPDFPTVTFPNPEEGKSTLDLSLKTADENGSTVILANDPDADRLAVAVKLDSGSWKVFTGNEIGAILGWWMWHTYKQKHPNYDASKIYMISSTVSSKILRDIGKKEGFQFVETLTGFKWMANKTAELMSEGNTILMAFEEAIGYMCGTTVLDKDGVSAAVIIAEAAVHLEQQGKTLYDQLQIIYKTYGYHPCNNSYYLCYCPDTIKKMFHRLRNFNGPNTYPSSLNEFEIESVRDLTSGYDSSTSDKKPLLPSSSSSQMITFTFKNGGVATLRTSGTEPKIKYYTELCAEPEMSNWQELDKTLERMVALLVKEWMQPDINNITPKQD